MDTAIEAKPAAAVAASPVALQTIQIPALGALWPEQGGHFAGIARADDGRTFAVIAPPLGVGELGDHEWGPYGKEIDGTGSFSDGLANTVALLASQQAGNEHPAAAAVVAFNKAGGHAGHVDWYLPAIGELQLAKMHCPEQFDQDPYHWSSTQDGRLYASCQDFEGGFSNYHLKLSARRARPFRRLFL